MLNSLLKKSFSSLLYSARPSICMDITAWAKNRQLPIIELHSPVIQELISHVAEDEFAKAEFDEHREVLERYQILVPIEKAYIRDSLGVVELPDGQLCYEGNWWVNYLLKSHSYKRRVYFKNRFLKGNWYSLNGMWSNSYYHWFHDILPRLETAFQFLPPDTKFLIHENPCAYQLQSLEAYGITCDRLEIQPQGVRSGVERLWLSTPLGHTGLGSGQVITRVAKRLIKHMLPTMEKAQSLSIYISRKKAASRRIVNENDFLPLLKERGFQEVVLEDLHWEEQIRLFFGATAIMGAHGAGLINMMFVDKKNIPLTEITGQKRTVPCYVILAGQLGMQFRRIHAEPIGDYEIADMRLPLRYIMSGNQF